MTTVDIILIVAAVFTGLLMTILAFFQRALKDLTAPEFALVMQRFLRPVRTHPLNYGLVTTSVLAAALVLLRRSPGVRSGSGEVGGLRRRSGHRIAVFRRSTTSSSAGRSTRRPRPGERRATATSASTRSGASGAAFVLFPAGLAVL